MSIFEKKIKIENNNNYIEKTNFNIYFKEIGQKYI
jgi:hypothetical protein